MGFGGQGSKEKEQDAQILGYQKQIADLSTKAGAKSDKAFQWFKKASKPALNFYTDILGGDRSAIEELLGPEISGIKDTYKGERAALSEFSPRGGAKASGNTALATAEASQIGDSILRARPAAANALTGLAGVFSPTAQGFGGQAISGFGSGANIGFGLNAEQEAIRQRQAAIWAALGQAAGSIAGGFAGGGGG